MSFELPQSSRPVILLAIVSVSASVFMVLQNEHLNLLVAVALFFFSGFFADMLTAFFHFGFDYVFPYKMPVLGPIAKEFRDHHVHPTLDPSNYVVNLTKGAYAALPLALLGTGLVYMADGRFVLFFVGATVSCMSVWALFFHQIHSYAHMGSKLPPEQFTARVAEIAELKDKHEMIRQFEELFETVPIPKWVRVLQRLRIFLNPAIHNLHHISFESDFSSVNGWSDPVTNRLFQRLAKYYQSRSLEEPLTLDRV